MNGEQTTDGRSLKERLREWRATKGWTQRQAADYFCAALSTYCHWEQQGQDEPRGTARRMVEMTIEEGKR